ncbi:hypothetical protein HYU18_05210 [Candidatus Woesearchaeota archaeon]|nr:hypothetical protein [Candidatus Woesearchaeota archaeon]
MAYALMSKAEYALLPIETENWRQLTEADGQSEVAFIDGGNSAIIQAPTAELHKIRTAIAVIKDNKLASIERKEGFLLAKATVENGKAKYTAELLESNLDLKAISSEATGTENPLAKVTNEARRMCEIAAAKEALKMLNGRGVIVLDGTLETFSESERKALNELTEAAAAKNAIVGAVAKTCSLLADTSESLISAAEKLGGGKEGYIIVAKGKSEKHKATVAIARLNRFSQHSFRIEAADEEQLAKLAASLKRQSNDIAFPGYPYGLVMADEFARISNSEAALQKAKTMATAKGHIRQLLTEARALNAHSILDRL